MLTREGSDNARDGIFQLLQVGLKIALAHGFLDNLKGVFYRVKKWGVHWCKHDINVVVFIKVNKHLLHLFITVNGVIIKN